MVAYVCYRTQTVITQAEKTGRINAAAKHVPNVRHPRFGNYPAGKENLAEHAEQQPSVVIASRRPVLRRALAETLAAYGISVLAEGDEGPESVTMTERHKPDVLIVDVETWGARLACEIEQLRKLSPKTRVVITTRFDAPRQASTLLAAGASAYLGKSTPLEELLLAVRGPWDLGRVRTVATVVSKSAAELTDRQLEVLVGAARGLSNSQIASRLHVTDATVKRHLANIYEKVGVSSRGQATHKALQEGWITASDILREDLESQGWEDEERWE